MQFDKYARLGAYHWREYERPTIYRDYVNGLRSWVSAGRILDVGAGDGLIAHILGAEGVEDDETAVSLARDRGANVIRGNAYALPFDAATLDVVFMGDVIEHLEFPARALVEAHRVLAPSGRLYVTTPPERKPVRPYHYREYTPATLLEEVELCGFQVDGPVFTRHERIHASFQRC